MQSKGRQNRIRIARRMITQMVKKEHLLKKVMLKQKKMYQKEI